MDNRTHKSVVVAALTVGAVIYLFPAFLVSFPYMMAEPGSADGLGGVVVFWSVGEWVRTLWVFVRGPKAGEPSPGYRWSAAGIVFIGAILGVTLGVWVMPTAAGWNAWDVHAYSFAVPAIAGHWFGRWYLRRAMGHSGPNLAFR